MNFDTLTLLINNPLFHNCDVDHLKSLLAFSKNRTYQSGEYLVHEGASDQKDFYLILSGQVEIIKRANNSEAIEADSHIITKLEKGEVFGEIALLGFAQRIASVRALTKTTVLEIPIEKMHALNEISDSNTEIKKTKNYPNSRSFYNNLLVNLGKQLSKRLLNTNLITVETLQRELVLQQERIDSIRFFLTMLFILAIYSYCSSFLHEIITQPEFVNQSTVASGLISVGMAIVFLGGTLFLFSKNSFPLSFYGLTKKRWKKSAFEGFLYTIPILFFLLFIKYLALKIYGIDNPVIEFNQNRLSLPIFIGLALVYCILACVQEIVVRGGVQSSLTHFLSGKYKNLLAILLSNLLFGMIHLHISLTLALAVLFFGFFWGWMFFYQKDLVGVSISHALIGFIGFNVIGFSEFVLI